MRELRFQKSVSDFHRMPRSAEIFPESAQLPAEPAHFVKTFRKGACGRPCPCRAQGRFSPARGAPAVHSLHCEPDSCRVVAGADFASEFQRDAHDERQKIQFTINDFYIILFRHNLFLCSFQQIREPLREDADISGCRAFPCINRGQDGP